MLSGAAPSRAGSAPAAARAGLLHDGEGRWKTTTEWPPPGVESHPWYLSEGGRLSRDSAAAETSDTYAVDPTATTGTTNRWATQKTAADDLRRRERSIVTNNRLP